MANGLALPERVAAAFVLSIPFTPRSPSPPDPAFAAIPRETFFYIRYFQEIVRRVSRRRSDLNAKTAIPFSDFPAGPDRGLAVIWPAGGDGPGVDGDRLLDQERQQGPRDPGLGSCLEGVERGTGALAGVDRCRKLENALGISTPFTPRRANASPISGSTLSG